MPDHIKYQWTANGRAIGNPTTRPSRLPDLLLDALGWYMVSKNMSSAEAVAFWTRLSVLARAPVNMAVVNAYLADTTIRLVDATKAPVHIREVMRAAVTAWKGR